jgi:hypothetical protein
MVQMQRPAIDPATVWAMGGGSGLSQLPEQMFYRVFGIEPPKPPTASGYELIPCGITYEKGLLTVQALSVINVEPHAADPEPRIMVSMPSQAYLDDRQFGQFVSSLASDDVMTRISERYLLDMQKVPAAREEAQKLEEAEQFKAMASTR